ncbi:MAG: hypothetical protein V7K27_16615 [Nostoc sp.]|uniref:hypothetical protein n=1 Tax=Nostoc sp. TaxID=1180 RepID=UPI002FF4D12C
MDLRIDRHNQMCITSRYKALPCNALVGGRASQFDRRQQPSQRSHSQAAAQERGRARLLS